MTLATLFYATGLTACFIAGLWIPHEHSRTDGLICALVGFGLVALGAVMTSYPI